MLGRSEELSIDGVEPVTLERAKQQLRVDFDTDDALIELYISAARSHCESLIGYALVNKTVRTTFDCFGPYLSLIGPELSITSVKYRNTDHVETTLATSQYTTSPGRTLRIYPATDDGWPDDVATTPGAVVVEHKTKADVTDNARAAILLMVTDLYENRSDGVRRYSTASEKLLNLLRETVFG